MEVNVCDGHRLLVLEECRLSISILVKRHPLEDGSVDRLAHVGAVPFCPNALPSNPESVDGVEEKPRHGKEERKET